MKFYFANTMHHTTILHPRRTLATITERRRERLREVIRMRQPDMTVVLENIWDPHNVSAILRTADAVGVLGVHLLYYIEKAPNLERQGKLSSASANKWLQFENHDSVEACYARLREKGLRIYASHLTRNSIPLYDLDLTQPVALVMGNESRGVSDAACDLADGVFHIPMVGIVQSLNVSVATAVTLYEAHRQRRVGGLYPHPTMTDEEVDRLLLHWSQR